MLKIITEEWLHVSLILTTSIEVLNGSALHFGNKRSKHATHTKIRSSHFG